MPATFSLNGIFLRSHHEAMFLDVSSKLEILDMRVAVAWQLRVVFLIQNDFKHPYYNRGTVIKCMEFYITSYCKQAHKFCVKE
jgi:hypothetical protein